MGIRRVVFAASLVAAAGCNLLTGASDLAVGEGDPVVVPPVDPDTGTTMPIPPEAGPIEDSAGPADAGTDARGPADAKIDADAGPIANAKRVFVTSTRMDGDMNGFVGGDQACATLAAAQSLGGTWVAWLSIQNGTDAIDRLTHAGPWYLVDQRTLVANDKAQLMSLAGIAHAVDRDEKGALVANDDVWTGTRAGRYFQNDCAGWTNGGFAGGQIGKTGSATGNWTASTAAACTQMRRVYCFEN